jgi:pyruvate/2-oxoacid:ferredoxin oxidoreductase beta subunit
MGFIATSPTCGAIALFRLYRRAGGHFYTTSAAERDSAVASGAYVSEGIAGYVWTSPAGS